MAWAIDSIANPHLNNDLGAIIAFPDETFGLVDDMTDKNWTSQTDEIRTTQADVDTGGALAEYLGLVGGLLDPDPQVHLIQWVHAYDASVN